MSSLRERSKERRRAAIEHAASTLFAEQGYDATTVAQVAELAEVAPRTVSMYFSSKLHLALAYQIAATDRLADAVRGRADGAPAVETVLDWLRTELDEHGEQLDLQSAMFRANPEIRGAETPELAAARALVVAALARDLGRAEDDVVVALAGGAFQGIVDALVQLGRDRTADAFDAAAKLLLALTRAARA